MISCKLTGWSLMSQFTVNSCRRENIYVYDGSIIYTWQAEETFYRVENWNLVFTANRKYAVENKKIIKAFSLMPQCTIL